VFIKACISTPCN